MFIGGTWSASQRGEDPFFDQFIPNWENDEDPRRFPTSSGLTRP
jgi:hypothetical protein